MVSDDTEHTGMVAQSLIVSSGEVSTFTTNLAWRLRFWLIGLPGGIGYATLKAILKLWLGFKPEHSGIFSTGNGSTTRSAIIGVCYGNDSQKLPELVIASTRLTHTGLKTEFGALAVAIAAYLSSQRSNVTAQKYYFTLQNYINDVEFLKLIKQACDSVDGNIDTQSFAAQIELGGGVSSYIYHTYQYLFIPS